MSNDLDRLIADAQAPYADPIVTEQNVRILDYLLIVRNLLQQRADGINARAAAAKEKREADEAATQRAALEKIHDDEVNHVVDPNQI